MCGIREETEFHLVWGCGRVREVWERLGWEEEIEDMRVHNFESWLISVWDAFGAGAREVLMTTCWSIWNARNMLVFEGQSFNGMKVCERATGLIEERAKEARHGGKGTAGTDGSGPTQRQEQWRGPEQDIIKINVDATIMEGRGVGYGAVARGWNGEVAWCRVTQELRCNLPGKPTQPTYNNII
ncbi:hypothetical protein RND81_02G129800 [Saponaria officinalis]|uniref:RNase H type-1 domain-containing protein n=1 Tax=Saponaria officinalis TaxID=3572 RepID=A0AAW1MMI4_SAPOF